MSAFLCLFSMAAAQSKLLTIPINRRSNTMPAGTSIEAGLVNDLDDYPPLNDFIAQSGEVSLFSSMTNDETTKKPIYNFDLNNYLDYQYYGSLYAGSNFQEFEYIFDTGSPWLWVATTGCSKCFTPDLYDTSLSLTYTQ